MDIIKEFEAYMSIIGDRKSLYKLVSNKFHVKRALYPGSHVDISPSLAIPEVTYIDNFKGTIKFFNHMEDIKKYINEHKTYLETSQIDFIGSDYTNHFDLQKVDMIISQFAGFVGQATKRFLKKGGILLCNDSHGDATLAYLDKDYEFIGVIDSNSKIETKNIDKYFKFARQRDIDKNIVVTKMKGPKYKLSASNYIFMLK